MLIDTHCHLNFKAFDKDLKEIINAAKKVGVEKIIIPGAKIDSSSKACKIASIFPNCFAAVGIHPHHANLIELSRTENQLSNFIKEKGEVIAIGEIGLDYHQYKGYPPLTDLDKENQKKLFLLQIEIAAKHKLPVIIHCRNAFDELLALFNNFTAPLNIPKGVFHCFSGNKNHLAAALDLGFYIGFDGNITYPENKHLQEVIKSTPLPSLLLETDSPFLSPIPYRGSRNTPANLVIIAQNIAQIHHQTAEKIEEITYSNAMKLFHL
jgi:TatD DNase family protein